MSLESQVQRVLKKYAAIKGISVGKVLRNMARDFCKAAQEATPLATKGKSDYWYYIDGYGARHYLHSSQLKKKVGGTGALTKTGKPHKVSLKAYLNAAHGTVDAESGEVGNGLHKVRIAKGWSKAAWIGAMKDLGMTPRDPRKGIPSAVLGYGDAILAGLQSPNPEIDLRVGIRFDRLASAEKDIVAAGWRSAWHTLTKDFARILAKAKGA